MSERIEAAGAAIHSEISDWYPLEGVQNLEAHSTNLAAQAIAAADAVMFSDEAVERAADEVLNHWRGQAGKCECGEFTSRDPQRIARHLTSAVIAALKGDA